MSHIHPYQQRHIIKVVYIFKWVFLPKVNSFTFFEIWSSAPINWIKSSASIWIHMVSIHCVLLRNEKLAGIFITLIIKLFPDKSFKIRMKLRLSRKYQSNWIKMKTLVRISCLIQNTPLGWEMLFKKEKPIFKKTKMYAQYKLNLKLWILTKPC